MEKEKYGSIKNKNVFVVLFEIIVILIGLIGITYATSKILSDRSQTNVVAGEYNLDYIGDKEISFNEIEPRDSKDININTKDNVIRVEFSLRGVSTNKDDNLIYDVMLNEINIDSGLLNEYTKWNLYKNGKLLSSGNLSPSFDSEVLGGTMKLTNIQENLPKHNQNYDKYVLIFWIEESCDDILKCKPVDQNNIIDSSLSMKVFIGLYGGVKKKAERIPNYDMASVNIPILYDNMIPVVYKNGLWIVADKNNSDKTNKWYDYTEAKWANSVIVNNNMDKYNKVGVIVDNSDILAHYVWIPRFKYKLWNAMDKIDDSYNAYDNGIMIKFQSGDKQIDNNNIMENNQYITHPVFNNNLKGFWINKYELSKKNDKYLSVSSVESDYYDTIENYRTISSNLSNSYLLGNNASTHMVNNLEWGATLYLSHSKYGICMQDGCIRIDNNKSIKSGTNKWDTSTRNVYGVYDMSGGVAEYVDGNYKIGSATYEVFLPDKSAWYNGSSLLSDRDYLIRGGHDNELFSFGDISMSTPHIGTRSVIYNK